MTIQNKNISFLEKLAEISAGKTAPAASCNALSELFKQYFGFDKTEIIVFDNSSMQLRNFADSRIINSSEEINFIYNSLVLSKGENFYFNEEEFSCIFKEEEEYRLFELNFENAAIIFPLAANGEVYGVMKLSGKEINNISKEFFSMLNISSKLVSGAVISFILNEQMEAGLNFYRAMKDIAKIIESQYELNYIIPLIGEMIDRFTANHLIYIFMRRENKYQLVWPKSCRDENVYKLLEKIQKDDSYLLSEDNKIGIFPITDDEKISGAIAAYSNTNRLFQKDIDYLAQLSAQAGMTIHRANVYAEVLKYAVLDALTGLNNRRQFEIRVKQEVSKSRRNHQPLCCIMLDADYFKKVNDTYGHAAGDCVLKKIAEVIMQEIREYDTAFRYGGEEFFIILPETKLEDAVSAAERLRRKTEQTKIEIKDAHTEETKYINITISLGVCGYDGIMNAEEFAQKADKALYNAKEAGRNRVSAL